MAVPSELREWLFVCNGANVNPGGIYGLGSAGSSISIETFLSREPLWIKKHWLPIANDGSGDYYVVAANDLVPGCGTTPVLFLDQSDYTLPAYVVASSLKHFLWFILTNELLFQQGRKRFWPFDKNEVLAVDPALINYHSAPLAWNTVN
jgi:cell wall assembly regulator SMI1